MTPKVALIMGSDSDFEKLKSCVAKLKEFKIEVDVNVISAHRTPAEAKEFTATAGGEAVEVTVSGKREVLKVKLAEEVVDPDDIEMLEDLIVAATNEALRKVDEESSSAMSKLTGGLGGGIPGMF